MGTFLRSRDSSTRPGFMHLAPAALISQSNCNYRAKKNVFFYVSIPATADNLAVFSQIERICQQIPQLNTVKGFRLLSLSLPPPLMFNNNNNNQSSSSRSPSWLCVEIWIFPPRAIWIRIIELASCIHTHTHTHTRIHSVLQAFWWENSEGSASLTMWRSYILNQIYVCVVCVCYCLLLSTSLGYSFASAALRSTQYLPLSFVTGLHGYCVWCRVAKKRLK